MQSLGGIRTASDRTEVAYDVIGSVVRVEFPPSLCSQARTILSRLETREEPNGDAARSLVRVRQDRDGWVIEADGCRARATSEDETLLSLQEAMIEAAARHGDRLLFRGSVVARGSQSLLVVGDIGTAHALLAVALTALGFGLVSVGTAAFDGRRLTPLPMPLAFRLGSQEQDALRELPPVVKEHLEQVAPELFAPRLPVGAPEPTHVIFPESHGGRLSIVRPISAVGARSRLCHALIAAPGDQSPFAAIAGILRHTRGIHLSMGALPRALEQLSRLLPQWRVEEQQGPAFAACPGDSLSR
jgi:hypothetical protein